MQGDLREPIVSRLEAKQVAIPPAELLELHERYVALLAKWNRTINLTALQLDPASDEAIDRLLVEPIAASYLAGRPENIIDLGSGGGSPAIPFWIQLLGSTLTMVESRSRKCAFLREAVRQIRPGNGTAIESRFEELLDKNPGLRQSADIVTIRAVRLDGPTVALAGALLRPEGRVFLFGHSLQVVDCSTWNSTDKPAGSS